jgi:hypothetical protein
VRILCDADTVLSLYLGPMTGDFSIPHRRGEVVVRGNSSRDRKTEFYWKGTAPTSRSFLAVFIRKWPNPDRGDSIDDLLGNVWTVSTFTEGKPAVSAKANAPVVNKLMKSVGEGRENPVTDDHAPNIIDHLEVIDIDEDLPIGRMMLKSFSVLGRWPLLLSRGPQRFGCSLCDRRAVSPRVSTAISINARTRGARCRLAGQTKLTDAPC